MKVLVFVPFTPAWRRRRCGKACGEALAHLHELIDEELPDDRFEARLRHHVSGCTTCHDHLESLRELKVAVARVERTCDPELSARLVRLADELCQDSNTDKA